MNDSKDKKSNNNSISKDKEKNKFDEITSILTKEEKIEIEKKVNN